MINVQENKSHVKLCSSTCYEICTQIMHSFSILHILSFLSTSHQHSAQDHQLT